MLKNWRNKLIAMLLIFVLTFSNFALVGKTYATAMIDGIFSNNEEVGDTGSANVEFDAYFLNKDGKKETEVKTNVNNKELLIGASVNVKESGYLKDAKIILGDGEELNFNIISKNDELNENIQTFEDNKLNLVQLNAGSEVKLSFPIEYENDKYMDASKVSKTNKITFEGIYVNENAEEIKLSKSVDLSLSWKDNREAKVSSKVTKYIDYKSNGNSGLILQTLVSASNETEGNSLPVKKSTLKVEAPIINNIKANNINVVATSTAAVNGKSNDEVVFNKDNWSYDKDKNIITINVENKKELVSTQKEDEALKDEKAKKELYYSTPGKDTYLITYTYSNISMNDFKLKSKVSEEYTLFGDDNKLNASNEFNYEVSEKIGDIVTYSSTSETKSVSKGYTYLNYNNDKNKYEIDIDSKIVFNISYKDIVEALHYEDAGNNYITKNNEVLPQNDIYYKSLVISEENFKSILGDKGYIKLYEESGEEIFTINKDTSKNNSKEYELKINSSVKHLKIETSKPIADGNLIIKTTKAYSNVGFDKEQYKSFDRLTINTAGKAKYSYVNELADCGKNEQTVKLEDTTTSAKLEVGQDKLSTLAVNNNVELKLVLNNNDIKSDVYGDSEFTIKMPDYVEKVDVTDASIVYGEGLELNGINAYEDNGNIYLNVKTKGTQQALSSGIVSNGTNIVLNSNIKVDLFAPASEEKFELTYSNKEATAYKNEKDGIGYDDESIEYSAPSGVVSVNSTSNYNDKSETVTSIKQGKKTGKLAIYSDRKEATMELIVMNNEQNSISNVKMLGRIPFEGVKDIQTGNILGTTVTGKMISGIEADNSNGVGFTVYYSENGNATANLEDTANGWTKDVQNFDKIKSYLIVPNDANYQMETLSKLRFTYKYEIPANLEHNADMYGTFATYYTNNTQTANLNEVSVADLVGVSTGEGPQIDIATTVASDKINEFEKIEIITTVKNKGKVDADNVVVEVPNPEYTTYVESKYDETKEISIEDNSKKATYKVKTLKVGEELKLHTFVKANKVNVLDEENVITKVYSQVTADDFEITLKSEEKAVTIHQAELSVEIENRSFKTAICEGDTIDLIVTVQNLEIENLNKLKITLPTNKLLSLDKLYILEMDENFNCTENEYSNYNVNSDNITWTIDVLEPARTVQFRAILKVNDLKENIFKNDLELFAQVNSDGTENYKSNSVDFTFGKPILVIKQTTSTTNTYVKEGESINYKFSITNEGAVDAESVELTDQIPEGLVAKTVSYGGIKQELYNSDDVVVSATIRAGETLDVNVETYANRLNGKQELSVTNSAEVTAENSNAVTSNKITHIIESSGQPSSNKEEKSTALASSAITGTSGNLNKTYKISGIAWLDGNKNGTRDDNEKLLKDIKATLVDTEDGVIKQSTLTNSDGEYTFSGVANGNYIVIFDYDTVLYTVTTYKKDGVISNVNSDVITTKIEQDGEYRNAAVTETVTVTDGSISNIDIGLVEANKFDLSLNMGISKITVQNSNGTQTTNYDNDTLTKTEIGAKQMNGSVVYIEYILTVKNEGEISGFAKKIVDNLPEGMEFNSGMNTDWYSGNDGKLYTTALSEKEIKPGETKTLKLVLSRTMTNNNTGMVTNTAEITEDYNIYGISDCDSVPNNNSQSEDDFARADALLSVRTGEVFVYISVIITTLMLIGIAVFIVVLKNKYKVNKGGV